MIGYSAWFHEVIGVEPHPWQQRLGEQDAFERRLLRIPTGFGKTLGVLLAWTYHRVHRRDERWPRRLVWCLPMRVLVEQTYDEACRVLARLGLLWDEDAKADHRGKVGVHLLMGGAERSDWHLHPEECSILIGTQDMLLSRALNRGYGAPRARWPMEFGLLHQDALWVLDEVQLMDVGLATSAQLEAFRAGSPGSRPSGSFWMSATLQPSWLSTRDTRPLLEGLTPLTIPDGERRGELWEVRKPCQRLTAPKTVTLAGRIAEEHLKARNATSEPTLVVVNTVDSAIDLVGALRKQTSIAKAQVDIRLVHSRYRPHERKTFRSEFLNREKCVGANRIIVATQVVEAGVDISSSVLFTELAPWPSLVQRFGRAARWGGTANVFVIDTAPKDDLAALPYSKAALDASRDTLERISDVAPRSLERFEEDLSTEEIAALYPYEASSLLLETELYELFDTTADLTGADVDVSRFIRAGEERDLHVFWGALPDTEDPDRSLQPSRDALCTVPVGKARKWLCGDGRGLKDRRSAWVWDYLRGVWRVAEYRDLRPGNTVLVDASFGGYDWNQASREGVGWTLSSKKPVEVIPGVEPTLGDEADAAQDDEALSHAPKGRYKTIATHGAETAKLAGDFARELAVPGGHLLALAAKLHDVGKAHPAFQGSIHGETRPSRSDLAKAPEDAWPPLRRDLYRMTEGPQRKGFRHELASALALFSILQRHDPNHVALLGPWRELHAALGERPLAAGTSGPPSSIERAVLDLSADDFDLVAYLVLSHHGKIRSSLHATPTDQALTLELGDVVLRGVRRTDILPRIPFGAEGELPESSMDLSIAAMGISATTGASWGDRAERLLSRLGPFHIAWLEALLRAADQRASKLETVDPLL